MGTEISVEKFTLNEGPLAKVRGWSAVEGKVSGNKYRAAAGVRTWDRISH